MCYYYTSYIKSLASERLYYAEPKTSPHRLAKRRAEGASDHAENAGTGKFSRQVIHRIFLI